MSYRYGDMHERSSAEAFITAWCDLLGAAGITDGDLASLAEDRDQAEEVVRSVRDDVGLPTVVDVSHGDHEDSPEVEAEEEDHVEALQIAAGQLASAC